MTTGKCVLKILFLQWNMKNVGTYSYIVIFSMHIDFDNCNIW